MWYDISGVIPGQYEVSETMKNYFKQVQKSSTKIFGENFINSSVANINLMPIVFGDLNKCSLDFLSNF